MDSAIKTDANIMHGTPCFAGTRVAVQTLFDWIEEGHTIDYFLEQFPSVGREQVMMVLESAKRRTVEDALAKT
ncbi:MAG: DUF433 domain-containing protein [Tepidisphaeraceae bacterium]|jgi:uncharacterized protein (DUF433 family)